MRNFSRYPPFYDDNPWDIYRKIIEGYFEFPPSINPRGRDIIKQLLTQDAAMRLGSANVRYLLAT